MPLTKDGNLSACIGSSNCFLIDWEFGNVNQAYTKLIKIASEQPRTKVLEESNNYWHAVCRSLFFRFPDDLEILKQPRRGIIQVRSASRYGASDLGVNERRVKALYKKLVGGEGA